MPFDATDYQVTTLPDPLSLTTPRERLEYLRDFLRALPPERFDMGDAGDTADAEAGECGSAACIGGWARARFRLAGDLYEVGREAFGLSNRTIVLLFYPSSDADGFSPYRASPIEAAQVLDHLIRTGEVDWSVARAA